MTGGLAGLTGLTINNGQEASPEQRSGDSADPRHAEITPHAASYPWEIYPGETHGPYGTENGLLGMPVASSGGGILQDDPTADRQPLTHAAPMPKGVVQNVGPDDEAERRQTSAAIHSRGFGLSKRAWSNPASVPTPDNWETVDLTDPGEFVRPLANMPAQQKGMPIGGALHRDRSQSFAEQNEYGFDSAHVWRRWRTGGVEGNFLWLQGGFRPLVAARVGSAAIPNGLGSPFAGQSGTRSFDTQGAALYQLPAPYVPPAEPAQSNDFPAASPGRVRLW